MTSSFQGYSPSTEFDAVEGVDEERIAPYVGAWWTKYNQTSNHLTVSNHTRACLLLLPLRPFL